MAASRLPESFPDDFQIPGDPPQIQVAAQIQVHPDLRPFQLGRCVSDASDGERPEPFPAASPEPQHRQYRLDTQDEAAGRSACVDLPEEEEEQDT